MAQINKFIKIIQKLMMKLNGLIVLFEYTPFNIKNLIYYTPIRTKISGNPNEPWFTRRSIEILKKLIKPEFKGFEFGTGASTIWLGKRIESLISIEHYELWYKKIKTKIIKKKLKNINLNLVPLKNNKYIDFIKKFPKDYFDIVFIDGRERVKCIMNSIDRIKPKGILVLDNSEREKYSRGKELINNWKEIETSNGVWKTTIWIKPVII